MQIFTHILLVIILFLLILDVLLLYKIHKNPITRNRNNFDKRYFELKFEIRIIETVAAILLFVGTFLGVSSLNDIKEDYRSDLEDEIKVLKEESSKFEKTLSDYATSLEDLKYEEGKSIENLNDVKRQFALINNKVKQTQDALRYTSKIYLIRDLNIKTDVDGTLVQRYYFNKMRTIY